MFSTHKIQILRAINMKYIYKFLFKMTNFKIYRCKYNLIPDESKRVFYMSLQTKVVEYYTLIKKSDVVLAS